MRISDWSSDVLFRSDLHAIWGGIDLGASVRTHELGRRHGRQAEGCRGKEDFDEAELEGHGSLPAVLNGQIRMEKRPKSITPSPTSDCGAAKRSATNRSRKAGPKVSCAPSAPPASVPSGVPGALPVTRPTSTPP